MGIICRKASKRIRIKRFFGACPFLFFDSLKIPRDQNEICKLLSYTVSDPSLKYFAFPLRGQIWAIWYLKLNLISLSAACMLSFNLSLCRVMYGVG